jgi:Sensors of blue-light using FAD
MIQLVYVSSSVKPFCDNELLQLLERCRRNNDKLGITGMLLYKNGDFMQALDTQSVNCRETCKEFRPLFLEARQ